MTNFRPMLAESDPVTEAQIEETLKRTGHLWASVKLDGIRCTILNAQPHTRSLKLIPNKFVRQALSHSSLTGLDGELIEGAANDPKVFNRSQSAFMSEGGQPDWKYYLFDDVTDPSAPFRVRQASLRSRVQGRLNDRIVILEQVQCTTLQDVLDYEAWALEQGYEGLILRDPSMPYKYGRSTYKQAGMLKMKRFKDSEAEIIGFEELMRNQNEARIDNLGLQRRSAHKAGKVAGNTLGKLLVRDIHHGWEFAIGSGFDDATRHSIWNQQDRYLGKVVTYKYQPHGMKDLPRIPVFKGFRDKVDMS